MNCSVLLPKSPGVPFIPADEIGSPQCKRPTKPGRLPDKLDIIEFSRGKGLLAGLIIRPVSQFAIAGKQQRNRLSTKETHFPADNFLGFSEYPSFALLPNPLSDFLPGWERQDRSLRGQFPVGKVFVSACGNAR